MKYQFNLKNFLFSVLVGVLVFQWGCSGAEKSMTASPDQITVSTNESETDGSSISGIPGISSEMEIIVIEPNKSCVTELPPPPDPLCNTSIHQRIPYDSQGALVLRYNDLINSLLVQNAIDGDAELEANLDEFDGEVNSLLSTLKLNKETKDIEVIAVGGNFNDITEDFEFDPYFIVKFYDDIAEDDLDALRTALDEGPISFTTEYESDDGTVIGTSEFAKVSDVNGVLRISMAYSDSEGDNFENHCDIESQFISCAQPLKVDQLKFVREGSLPSIHETEKSQFMGCSTAELFIETMPVLEFAESESVDISPELESVYGDGLFEVTLNVYNAVESSNTDSVFGYGQLVLAYWQDEEWQLGLTVNMSDRFFEDALTNSESLSELF